MLTKIYAAALQGIEAQIVTIEVNCTQGIQFFMVGLPDAAVKESHQRIISALSHNSLKFPRRKVVVNLAPADIKKEGSAYDLPIAIGLLAANEEFKSDRFKDFLIMGELSLDGSILPIKGALPIAIMAKEQGYKGFILPKENASEAAVIDGLKVYGVENITEVVNFPERPEMIVQGPCSVSKVVLTLCLWNNLQEMWNSNNINNSNDNS